MSAIDAGQVTLGIVWVNDGAAGGAYGAGNDTTGDGTPAAPYLTLDQAMQEIRTVEGQVHTTQNWEVRLLSEAGGGEDYGRVDHIDDDVHPCTDGNGWVLLSGWNKTWAINDRGQWLDQADKPGIDGYRRANGTVTNDLSTTGIHNMYFCDLNFFATSNYYYQNDDSSITTVWVVPYFFGCKFDRSSTATQAVRTNTNTQSLGVFIACQFFRQITSGSSGNNSPSITLINCYFYNNQDLACVQFTYSSGGGQPAGRMNAANCIFVADGPGIYCWYNGGSRNVVTTASSGGRTANVYNPRNGALWCRAGASTDYANLVYPQGSGEDEISSQLNPLMVDDLLNPQLSNASPAIDKGCTPSAIIGNQDPSGNELNKRDGLGFRWADVINASTPNIGVLSFPFSHRGVGPIQNPLIYTTEPMPVSAPIGIIGYAATWVAGEVQLDPDGVGTGQIRLIQADDDALTTNIVILDSAPEHVVATNKYIDIQEDGGIPAAVVLDEGAYNTAQLVTHIQSKLNGAGLTGTYTVSYNSGTELFTISATGLTTGFEILWLTGANRLNSCRRLIGFSETDTPQQTSVDSDFKILENFHNASRFYEYSSDYDGVSDPAASGTWNSMGNGSPSDVGVEGTDGVSLTASPRYVRVDMNNESPVNTKFHSFGMWNGNLVSDDTAAV